MSGGPSVAQLLGGWTFQPVPAAACALLAGLYTAGLLRAGRWPLRRTISYAAGVAAIALAVMSGIDRWSDLMLSVHMVQHLLLLIVAPPLLLYGAPIRLALKATRRQGRRRIARVLHHPALHVLMGPVAGTAIVAAVLLGTHLTGEFELALEDPLVHHLEHAAYFLTGMVLFAPLIAADPRPPGALSRFSRLTIAMTPMTIVSALLIFGNTVRYPYYVAPARALGISALADQKLAGVVMWIGGGVAIAAMGVLLAVSEMLAEERRQRRRDALAPPLPPLTPLPPLPPPAAAEQPAPAQTAAKA